MAKHGPSPFDADILRAAFRKAVKDESTPESKWRELAAQLIATYTGSSTVDPDLVEWIVQSESHQ